ncbi:GIY-YIG nuclease family protein [Pseudobacteroides cellulosolvens]|uniref:Excinuclease ABC C subunit domain protein n=1 Tax=Pseudobacteroides cellulosolvens ATCC 35603 = DSM 2933 TaxID=398512 RepID=A0A0L6JHL3_9FIRM|nr:GIY-YIG nuclease family protein [Pseudobacteroides cellulosolvens]KNY24982.1 Excinuclease ABC C subunit domain protein [Pseudobacteroides cellulosolvens ATCC 35603 = DSM 2933]
MKQIGVYQIVRKDTFESYVGHSKDIKKRFSTHKSNLKKGKFKYYNTFNEGWKISPNNIGFETLDECTVEELTQVENDWIEHLKQAGFIVVNKNKAGKVQYNSEEVKKHKSIAQTGSKNGNARLKDEDVIEMRRKFDNNEASLNELVELYKMSYSQVHKICVSKTTWKHLL